VTAPCRTVTSTLPRPVVAPPRSAARTVKQDEQPPLGPCMLDREFRMSFRSAWARTISLRVLEP